MRIALFHCRLPAVGRKPGGVEVFTHRLANALTERGNEVEVLTYSEAPADARYEVRRIGFPHAEESRFVRQYLAPWGMNFQNFDGFDVLHTHGDDWFHWRRSLPVVRTFHGSAKLERDSATSLKRRVDKSIVYPLELLGARLATSSYGVGPDSAALYATEGIISAGADLDVPPPSPGAVPTILFIGTWEGRKRGKLLHQIFRNQIRPQIPDAQLWMVAEECDPTEGVTLFEAPTDAELRDLFSRAWVYCMPSSYEGFGMPYLEALAHGVPVVASSNPGSQMLLDGGRFGVIADDREIGPNLIELLRDPERRAAQSKLGLERAKEFSWGRIAERYEDAYRSAIARFNTRFTSARKRV